MKKLNEFVVETAMDLLIHTNGKTSTLEVKDLLRGLGYNASQNDVSRIMEELHDNIQVNSEDKYIRGYAKKDGKKFYEYMFLDLTLNGLAEEEIDQTTGALSVVKDDVSYISKSDALSDDSDDIREPKRVFYTESAVTREMSTIDQDDWIAHGTDRENCEYHVYDKAVTRDQARSKYVSLTKVKIHEVRACKASNFASTTVNA